MRWTLLLLVGCRQILGIDDPHAVVNADAPITIGSDASIDASCADDDHDGVCNTVDDWPCGAKPDPPLADIASSENTAVTQLTVSGFGFSDGSKLTVVAPGDALSVHFSYHWVDSGCALGCIDQIELGYTPGDRVGCAFDAIVPLGTPTSGTVSAFAMTAPATTGLVALQFGIGQNNKCDYQGAHTWFLGPPGASDTLAYLCVH